MAVSSFDTRSTQSNSLPMGRESRIRPARSRTMGAMRCKLAGATVGLTALRCTPCSGSSMVMKPAPPPVRGRASSPSTFCCSARATRLGRVMPWAEEKISWLVSTAMMSFHRVTDQ